MAALNTQYPIPSDSFHSSALTGIQRPQRKLVAQAISTALVAGVATAPLLAQDLVLEEIIVTATKRAESVMEVPLAIQALSGDFIRKVNLNDAKDLAQFTPGVTGNSKDSFIDAMKVRGIGTNDFGNGGDTSIGMYRNGLYQGRTGSGVVSLYDIERAEILRGPQGFLFGRSSISGAMNIHTRRPTNGQREGYFELGVGERGVVDFEGGVTATMSDTFALRFAAQHAQEDGYITNVFNGNELVDLDKQAIRVTGVYDNDNVEIMGMIEYETRDQSGTVYKATGNGGSYAVLESFYGPLNRPSDSLDVNITEPPAGVFDDTDMLSFGLEINVDTALGTFTSLTGFKDHEYSYTENFGAVTLLIFDYEQYQEGDYFEQEFRLTSDTDGPLSWYAGVSYYDENIDTRFLGRQDEDLYCNIYWGDTCQGIFDFYNTYYYGAYAYVLDYYFGSYTWTPSPTGFAEDWNETLGNFRGWGAYVDLNYQFNDSFDASLGIRYSWDEKDFSQEVLSSLNTSVTFGQRVQTGYTTPGGALTDKVDWNDTTYRFSLNFRPGDDHLIFASISTGYKPGGFNSFTLTPVPVVWGNTAATPGNYVPAHFNEETSTSYEIGYKGTLADGRAQVTINAFSYEFKDMQSVCGSTTPVVIVCNVGKLEATGFEGTLNAVLSDNWQVAFGFSTLDSEASGIQDFCSGGSRVFGTDDVCEGNSIPNAPEFTWYAAIDMDYPVGSGTLFGNLVWSWEDERRSGWLPLTPASTTFPEGARMIDGFSIGQLIIGYESQSNWTVSAYVENLTDETYWDGGNTGGNPNNMYVQYDWGPGRPRTAGARFSYRFD